MPSRSSTYGSLLPVISTVVFIALYIAAALYYPGGSQQDPQADGFSWLHNYWCNLLNEYAINGQPNRGRYIAFAAMFVLILSLISFWWMFPLLAGLSNRLIWLMRTAGSLSMITAVFLFTGYHDEVINIAGVFGLVAIGITYFGLYQLRWLGLFAWGLFNLLLIGLNNLLYYGNDLLFYLPVVQKISFLSFLLWISTISLHLQRQQEFKTQ